MLHKNESFSRSLRVGIVGAGFSGTALVAAIHRLASQSVEIHLFDKSGLFAAGQAYKTPFPFHLLNARVCDMSAYEEMPMHFCDWLSQQETGDLLDTEQPIAEQFVPRVLYHQYLRSILNGICADSKGNTRVVLHANEVVDLIENDEIDLLTDNGQKITVDKAILAIGVEPPGRFPFPVSENINRVANPWHYEAVADIPVDEPVLIVGSGLSMVDAVLTLHHKKHRGPVVAVSRHGMLPLPHANLQHLKPLHAENLPQNLRALVREVRALSQRFVMDGGDWRAVFNMLRHKLPDIWRASEFKDKKRFLRHVLPYWNIHRHRLHDEIFALLDRLQKNNWLTLHAARVISVADDHALIRPRHSDEKIKINAKWIINCMGFSLHDGVRQQPLLASLLQQKKASFDPLYLGFDVAADGLLKDANSIYAVGPPTQGEAWETVGVPEIRKQCLMLSKILLKDKLMQAANI